MSHLMQLQHDSERLDLGLPGRVLLTFLCQHFDHWHDNGRTNALLILDAHEMLMGLTEFPGDDKHLIPEACVTQWMALDEEASQGWHEADADQNEVDPADEEEAEVAYLDSAYMGTKLGGVPTWVQSPESLPSPFRFVGQFQGTYEFSGPVPRADDVGCTVSRTTGWFFQRRERPRKTRRQPTAPQEIFVNEDGSYYCEAIGLGDFGTLYLFVNTDAAQAVGEVIWQYD